MKEDPKVSVIMGVFNGAKYLSSSIESIINQEYKNFEFIIINDGSTDGTAEILKHYMNLDSRIIVKENKINIGLTKSLNIALFHSRGMYIARQDSDDISEKSRLFEQVSYLEKNPDIAILGGHYRCIDGDNKFISDVIKKPLQMQAIKLSLVIDNPFVHGSVVFRRSVAVSLGGYNESYRTNQDIELWSRMLINNDGANLDKTILRLRIHSESISNSNYKNIIGKEREIIKERIAELVKNNMKKFCDANVFIIEIWLYDAFNKGISLSTGEIIGFLNADDFYASSNVLTQIAEAFYDPAVCAVYGDLEYVGQQDTSKVVRRWRGDQFNQKNLTFGWMPAHPTLYVRREWYSRIGGFDSNYKISADYLSVLKLFSNPQFKSVYIPHYLVKMRVGGTSNKSLSLMFRKSIEDWRALRSCHIGVIKSALSLACKNARKVKQFLK